jgi:hypothetical protein
MALLLFGLAQGFVSPWQTRQHQPLLVDQLMPQQTRPTHSLSPLYRHSYLPIPTPSSTSLSVWWFGGTETAEPTDDQQDSCELVAVRIERTSANSRRIYGEIVVPVPLRDVWAILTDYDRLSVYVPNLVESRIVQARGMGEPGDGTYSCRLYQKGAQKIIGFEFGASVTMDMQEAILSSAENQGERKITFKCADSFFFNEFDGEWLVKERINDIGQLECLLSYVVDVRPKGPVPVGPLEWRIREDVPTNLRAVKKAAVDSGYEGVMRIRRPSSSALSRNAQQSQPVRRLSRINVNWEREETMATYLNIKSDQ